MAESVVKILIEDQISVKDVIEWLSSDVEELKIADVYNAPCPKGDFVFYILNLLHQSFLSAQQLSIPPSKSLNQPPKTGENVKNNEKTNQKISIVKVSSVKQQMAPTVIQAAPELRREDRTGLCHTFSPPDIKSSQGEASNLSFKTADVPLLRTPPRSSFSGDSHFVTPILIKQRSAECDPIHKTSDPLQSSPVIDSRPKSNNRSLTLADFISKSPNQKKRHTNFTPKSDKIVTSTPSRDSEKTEDCTASSPAWKNKRPQTQRRIKPTKVLTFDDEKSPKTGFPKQEAFGIVARAQGKTAFETQADISVSQGLISFAEERNLLMDERLKLQTKSTQSTPPKITTLPSAATKTAVVKEVADPNRVTFQNHLLLLCDLYSNMIDANLIPNIMTELHFVLSLLVVPKSSPVKIQNTANSGSVSMKICKFNDKSSIGNKLDESKIKIANINFDKENSCMDISKEEKDVINSEEKKVDKDIGKSENEISLTDFSKTPTPNKGNSNCGSPLPAEELDGKMATVEIPAHLDTVHNCVFFATNVLWRQRHLLALLDRVTMKLLLDNERVATFMPNLASAIEDMYNKASPRTTVGQNMTATSVFLNCSTSENVTFHSERDNSTNFESSNAFRLFRKQRDAFYNIFQIWETEHHSSSWDFNAALKPKIRALLDMCRDSTNYMHLARLFRMQLLAAGMGGKRLSDDLDSSFLECLRGVDPEKLSRLRERLVTPHSSGGPRPSPQFPGQQEFFCEFIMAVDNVSFIEHLKDNLVSHLLELDQTDFCASDVEESDLVVDEETRQAYINCVTAMQLLAQFLGFIVFLPYRKAADIPRNIIESELAIRARVGPPLNVMACVIDAWTNRRLVVTLPWVVQYLGMLDEGSVELPFYRNTVVLLLQLYAGLARDIGKGYPVAPEDMSPKTVMLLRFVLGWLFEMPCLPGLFFLWKRTSTEQDYLQGTPDSSLIVKRTHRENMPCLNWSSSLNGVPSTPVDSLDLVDTAVLYAVCPFLLGLRGLLSTVQEANANTSGTVRHITPVSTALVQSEPVSTAQLELQLEETFFHSLPESGQKTVEFVVERITSACIKQICNTLIPNLKERGMAEFKNAIAEEIKNGMNDGTKEKLTERKDLVVKQVVDEMKSKCNEDVKKICGERCRAALTALLSQVSLPQAVCEMCIAISSRLSTERVTAWFRTHATFRTYAAELQDELKKALSNKGVDKDATAIVEKRSHLAACPDRKHVDTAPSPADVLIDLRDLICEILETHGEGIAQGTVDKIIDDVAWLIKDRADVTPAVERTLSSLLLDLSVGLVCHCPDLVTDSFIQKVIALWKNDALRPTDSSLSRIICPRNVLLLAQSSHPATKVWNLLAQVVGATLNEELVTADDVELQCLSILHQVWPQVVLMNFSSCVSEIVRIYLKKRTNVDSEKFGYLLNWLAEITKYIEDFPE